MECYLQPSPEEDVYFIQGPKNFPSNLNFDPPQCTLCKLPRLLVLQIYAPLEDSTFHRTLYIFACINPNCWNQNESWICLRLQSTENISMFDTIKETPSSSFKENWKWTNTVDADDWGDGDEENSYIVDGAIGKDNISAAGDNYSNFCDYTNETNGNNVTLAASGIEGAESLMVSSGGDCDGNFPGKMSDEDDESYSFEECDALHREMGNLSVDDSRNANRDSFFAEEQGVGAVGRLCSPIATAELEGNEGEVISIDTPFTPQRDVVALLQEVVSLPPEIYQRDKSKRSLNFVPYFINVYEEMQPVLNQNFYQHNTSNIALQMQDGGIPNSFHDRHVRELLQEYQLNNAEDWTLLNNASVDNPCAENNAVKNGDDITSANLGEQYEKAAPRHGDTMFHHFISKIHENRGQILRYSRADARPLLPAPLPREVWPRHCRHCNSDMIFELQVLPTAIPKLRLQQAINDISGGKITLDTKTSNQETHFGEKGGARKRLPYCKPIEGPRLEYGNVLIFTCRRSCWSMDEEMVPREEFVLVQPEMSY